MATHFENGSFEALWWTDLSRWASQGFDFTLAAMFKIATGDLSPGAHEAIACIADATPVSNVPRLRLGRNTNDTVHLDFDTATTSFDLDGSTTISGDQWYAIAAVIRASNDHELYLGQLNGTIASEGTSTTDLSSLGTDFDLISAGALIINAGGFSWLDGEVANIALWKSALSLAELQAYCNGMSPLKIDPDNLVNLMPMVRSAVDMLGNAASGNGTPDVADHPVIRVSSGSAKRTGFSEGASAVDIEVHTSVLPSLEKLWGQLGPFSKDASTLYAVSASDASPDSIVIRKSTNGGLTWSTAATKNWTSLDIETNGQLVAWWDKNTPGDTGTKIHIFVLDDGNDALYYVSFDTASDTFGTELQIATGLTPSTQALNIMSCVKAEGGDLKVVGLAAGDTGYAYKSEDGGSSFSAITHPFTGVWDSDGLILGPANTADTQDVAGAWLDVSANILYGTIYDDSADSWSTTTLASGMFSHQNNEPMAQFACVPRFSDGHLIIAMHSWAVNSSNDLRVFDFNPSASPTVTEKTQVFSNTAQVAGCGLVIDQQTDKLWIFYSKGGTYFDTTTVVGKSSTDGGATWSSEITIQVDAADDMRQIYTGLSVGDQGGVILPIWWNDDLAKLMCNYSNRVEIAAAGGGGGGGGTAVMRRRRN